MQDLEVHDDLFGGLTSGMVSIVPGPPLMISIPAIPPMMSKPTAPWSWG